MKHVLDSFRMELTLTYTNAHGKIIDFSQSKIGTYGNKNSHFQPTIICRCLTYVYHNTYFTGAFFNHGNYKI